MKKIIDKITLIICCFLLLSSTNKDLFSVIALLAIVSASSISQYTIKNKVSLGAEILYIILCFVNPLFLYYLPVIIYDILYDKRYYLVAISIVPLIFKNGSISSWQILFIFAITIISVILQNRTNTLIKLEQKFIETRDNSAELNMLLTEKNKHLSETQDYEIHLATLKERNRIAREIHDNVGHLLSRSILQVGALKITSHDDVQKESLGGLSDTLSNAMTTIRNSVHDLHDDSVDLKLAITDAVKPLEDDGLKVKLNFDFSNNIPNNIKFCLISIVKESVSNIIKHSCANYVTISLYEHPAFYQLMVEDNGKCSEEIINDNGMGLSNMRDRINSMNGLIQISSNKKGFRIFITLQKERS